MKPQNIAKIISTIGTSDFPEVLAEFLNNATDIDTIVIMAYENALSPLPLFDNCPKDKRYRTIDSYIAGTYKLDPFYASCLAKIQPGIYRLRTLAPDHFTRSQYFRTYYKQIGIHDELGYFIRLDSGVYIVISLGRYWNERTFSSKAIGELSKIEPIIQSSVIRHWKSLPLHETGLTQLPANPFKELTVREREIALMVLRGYSSEAVALNLDISLQTIKVHRRNIYAKLSISSATELFLLYIGSIGLRVEELC